MKVDLHIHTNASDGDFTIEQLLNKLSEQKVDYISFTDHEILSNCANISEGFKVINGIELYADYIGTEIHILGYEIKDTTQIEDFLQKKIKRRKNNYIKLLYALSKKGIKIPSEFFGDEKGDIHSLVTYIVQHSKASRIEIYKYYIEDILKEYPLIIRSSYKEATDIIKSSGGIAILAHPMRSLKKNNIDLCLKELKRVGIDGIEISDIQNSHMDDYIENILSKNLVVTCGSDFHGCRKNQIIEDLVAIDVKNEYLNPFLELIE